MLGSVSGVEKRSGVIFVVLLGRNVVGFGIVRVVILFEVDILINGGL